MDKKDLKVENRRLHNETVYPQGRNITTTERPVREEARQTVTRALAQSLKRHKQHG